MTTLITGGTGFLGRHLIAQLVERGEDEIRVLTRSFDLEIADMGVELVEGSLTDPADMRRAVDGVTRVYHLAGQVERDPRMSHRMYELHVDGTRCLLNALLDGGNEIEKIVVASTSGTVGVSKDPGFVADDDSPLAEMTVRNWPYYLSKIYAERVCRDYITNHAMPIVLMRPTLLLGPGDRRQSSTGDVLLFLQKKIPAAMSGGLSFVDVRDTAQAFILAMDKAPTGATYLLGSSNLTIVDFFKRLEELSGVRAPWLPLPDTAARFGARFLDSALRAVGKTPDVDPVSVEMAQYFWYIDSSRAQTELGWQPRSPNDTLRDTISWIRRNHPEFATRNKRALPPEGFVSKETLEYAEQNARDRQGLPQA